jgi:hypothetical protein
LNYLEDIGDSFVITLFFDNLSEKDPYVPLITIDTEVMSGNKRRYCTVGVEPVLDYDLDSSITTSVKSNIANAIAEFMYKEDFDYPWQTAENVFFDVLTTYEIARRRVNCMENPNYAREYTKELFEYYLNKISATEDEWMINAYIFRNLLGISGKSKKNRHDLGVEDALLLLRESIDGL